MVLTLYYKHKHLMHRENTFRFVYRNRVLVVRIWHRLKRAFCGVLEYGVFNFERYLLRNSSKNAHENRMVKPTFLYCAEAVHFLIYTYSYN